MAYLGAYAREQKIYLKACYANAEHVHALVDLPTSTSIEDMMHRFKGSSSHWLNEHDLSRGKFAWGRGYGVFSVSHSGVGAVVRYIETQEQHHRVRSFDEELRLLAERYGLKWREEAPHVR